jgi:Transposase, Mutator family
MWQLRHIWMAETRTDAAAAFDTFAEIYGTKYDRAVECLIKDRDVLLAFYDFPAEHWKHLRRRPTRSRAPSQPSVIARQDRKDASRTRQRLPDLQARTVSRDELAPAARL